MPEDITILKDPQLPHGADYAYLRSKGLEYIEKLGSKIWTDYNVHDPGITLLELLCYALTDLGYRTSLDIKDILAEKPGFGADPARQGFFTARDILTISPLTPPDYRKMLIDIDGIKNGWIRVKNCACDNMFLYADCKSSSLQYDPTHHSPVIMKGMYDILIEFDDEEGVGDLNNGKVKYNFTFDTFARKSIPATIEMRLPSWQEIDAYPDPEKYKMFRSPGARVTGVNVYFISGNRKDNGDIVDVPAGQLANLLRRPVYVTMDVSYSVDDVNYVLTLEDIPATLIFHNEADRKAITVEHIKAAIKATPVDLVGDPPQIFPINPSSILPKYAERIQIADAIISEVRRQLHGHRNLCEDYCKIQAVSTEEIAVCADIDVKPDADIESVIAEAYYRIDQYMSTDIKFYSLKELLDAGKTVDEIFDGPVLNNGFIDNDQLELTQLKTELHTSDVINLLMDIPGIIAVRNLTLVRYDRDGSPKESQQWRLTVTENNQPRLYIEGSKLLAYKNGLPFLPDKLELSDTLQVIKGRLIQPKFSVLDTDMPVPEGNYFDLRQYYPLQYSLPQTYGTSKAGLPATASEERRIQAHQLKAYLLFFEQMLVNYLEQLASVKELFAIDNTAGHTYFSRLLSDEDIPGITGDFYTTANGTFGQDVLNGLSEDDSLYLDRKNRFLNHMLARFGEQFTDYTLMLYAYTENKKLADETLIENKVSFLKDYPFISRNRAKGYNYKDTANICNSINISGLHKRIQRLLNFTGLDDHWELAVTKDPAPEYYWQFVDKHGFVLLYSKKTFTAYELEEDVKDKAKELLLEDFQGIMTYLADQQNFTTGKVERWALQFLDANGDVIVGQTQFFNTEAEAETAKSNSSEPNVNVVEASYWKLELRDGDGNVVAAAKQQFVTPQAAVAAIDNIVALAKEKLLGESIHIVEHLLLRPRVAAGDKTIPGGDPLLSICIHSDCNPCGDDDPYSFRMTVVMSGEDGPASTSMEFRRFAEDTIRMEIPAHIGLKICWINREQMAIFGGLYCAWQKELARAETDKLALHNALTELLMVFRQLKSVYPGAKLHDCEDGQDANRVYLNHTII